jgi:bifunctional non-homologous end joining protein LigD
MPVKKSSASTKLTAYKAKRNFTKTPEPSGTVSKAPASSKKKTAGPALMFCVQKHLASHLHYDFRLEYEGVLLSWAVPKGPSLRPEEKRLAMKVEDHPLDYGHFEGVIPEGYGAGVVMLWDTGTWEPEMPDIAAALAKGDLKFKLDGVKLKGSWVLVRTGGRGRSNSDDRTWLLIKHRDQWAGDVDVTEVGPMSVKSFGDMADILAADTPQIWESHKQAEGGKAGAMLRELIEEAGKRKAAKGAKKTKPKPKRRKATASRAVKKR